MVLKLRTLAVGLSALALVGCTTELQVAPLSNGEAPPAGTYAYTLPQTYFQVTGSVTLTGCTAVAVDANGNEIDTTHAGHKPVAVYRPGLSLTEAIGVNPVVTADGDAQFVIPYEKLRSWNKETNFTITANSNKTLSGVNATVNDQGGPVVLQGTLAAVQIAGGIAVPALAPALIPAAVGRVAEAAGGGSGGVGFAGVHKKKPSKAPKHAGPKPAAEATGPAFCTSRVLNALALIDAANEQIYELSKADATAKVTIPNPNIVKFQAQIARLQNDAQLIRPVSARLVPDKSATARTRLQLPVHLFSETVRPWLSDDGASWFSNAINRAALPSSSAVYDDVIVQVDLDAWTLSKSVAVPATPAGLVLRDPATGILRVCRGACSNGGATDIATPLAVTVPQFGRYMQYSLKNGVFENSSLAITVAADGTITSMGNHSTGTLSTNLATAGQIGTALGAATTARNTAITSQSAAAVSAAQYPDTVNKALADCLAQQAAARALGGTPIGACQ